MRFFRKSGYCQAHTVSHEKVQLIFLLKEANFRQLRKNQSKNSGQRKVSGGRGHMSPTPHLILKPACWARGFSNTLGLGEMSYITLEMICVSQSFVRVDHDITRKAWLDKNFQACVRWAAVTRPGDGRVKPEFSQNTSWRANWRFSIILSNDRRIFPTELKNIN